MFEATGWSLEEEGKDNAKFDSTYIQNLTNKCLPLWQNKRTKSELTSETVKRRKVVVYNGFLDSEESFLEKQKKAEQEEEHYKQTMQPNYKHFDNMSYLDTYKDSTNQDEDTDDEENEKAWGPCPFILFFSLSFCHSIRRTCGNRLTRHNRNRNPEP